MLKLLDRLLTWKMNLNGCADFVPKISKPHLWSIWSSTWYDQRIDRAKKWISTCQFIFISGSLPVKCPLKKNEKNFIAPKSSSWNFRGSLLSYFWAITFISAVIAILDPFGMLVPRISATVKLCDLLKPNSLNTAISKSFLYFSPKCRQQTGARKYFFFACLSAILGQ